MKLTLCIFETHERFSDNKRYCIMLGEAWITPLLTYQEAMDMYSFYRKDIGKALKSFGLEVSIELNKYSEHAYAEYQKGLKC